MKYPKGIWLAVLVVVVVALGQAGALFAQRADRGLITGLVTDPAGAAVPQATVRVTDEATSVETVVETTDAGNYTTPLLILGTYTVKVEKQGFKTFVRSGIGVLSWCSCRLRDR